MKKVHLTKAQIRKIQNAKREHGQRKNSVPVVPTSNDMLSSIFGPGMAGGAPLSSPNQLAFDNSYSLLTLNRIILAYAYATHGPIQTVIDQPVEDAFRGGLVYESDELDAEDIDQLEKYMNSFVLPPVKKVMKWAELFGGSGLIINTDQDPEKELNREGISQDSPLAFIDADRWELLLNFTQEDNSECPYNYYGQKLHKSRVVKIQGKEAPSFLRQRLQGWGMSAIERMLRPLQAFLKNEDAIYELLDEVKTDVWRIQDYNASLLAGGAPELIKRRLEIATMGKNYHNALILDKEDEYEQKQVSFSGLPDVLKENRIGMASSFHMPMTKLFGISAAGFNSGEDDIENYNSLVESEVRAKACEILNEVLPLACRQLFGYEPEVSYKFKPLRVMSSAEEENLRQSKFNRLSALYSQGMLTAKEYAEALKREEVFTMDTEVSQGTREPEIPMSSMTTDIPQEPAHPPKKGE